MGNSKPVLETPRLILRDWTQADALPFAAILADPLVTEFLPPTDRLDIFNVEIPLRNHFAHQNGLGWWAISERGGSPFIGFIGLSIVHLEVPFAPAIDMGWCLASSYWGKGYACEAAKRVMDHAFSTLKANEIVAFTVEQNYRARALMARLGMTTTHADDFEDPRSENPEQFRKNVLYRRKRD